MADEDDAAGDDVADDAEEAEVEDADRRPRRPRAGRERDSARARPGRISRAVLLRPAGRRSRRTRPVIRQG